MTTMPTTMTTTMATTMATTALAFVGAVSIPLLQSDWFSRRYLLSAESLQKKRHAEYRYRWSKALEKILFVLQYGPDASFSSSSFQQYQNQQTQEEMMMMMSMSMSREEQSRLEEAERLELLTEPEEILEFFRTRFLTRRDEETKKTSMYRIAAIGMDDKDPRAYRDYFLYLEEIVQYDDDQDHQDQEHDEDDDVLRRTNSWNVALMTNGGNDTSNTRRKKNNNRKNRLVQIPLVEFGNVMAEEWEMNHITTTTLCFVADASGGVGLTLLEKIFFRYNQMRRRVHRRSHYHHEDGGQRSSSSTSSSSSSSSSSGEEGIPVISRPVWMAMMADLLDRNVLSTERSKRILFALCRLEAWNVQSQVDKLIRTVVLTLPGQSCTPALLPALRDAFPEERHVFVYQGCADSVVAQDDDVNIMTTRYDNDDDDGGRPQPRRGSRRPKLPLLLPSRLLNRTPMVSLSSSSYSSSSSFLNHSVSSSSSLTGRIPGLSRALAELPLAAAEATECWMASVDAFLRLKEEEGEANRNKNNGKRTKQDPYRPYVCRLPFLLHDSTITSAVAAAAPAAKSSGGGSGSGKTVDENNKNKNESMNRNDPRRLAVRNLLQFIAGCRSRPLPTGLLDAALDVVVAAAAVSRASSSSSLSLSSSNYSSSLTRRLDKATVRDQIEECVFLHKGILLGDKILIDTVLPVEEWHLTASKKRGGCSCCGPEDEDEEEERKQAQDGEDEGRNDENDNEEEWVGVGLKDARDGGVETSSLSSILSSSSKTGMLRQRSKFIDGKNGFAFDPAKY